MSTIGQGTIFKACRPNQVHDPMHNEMHSSGGSSRRPTLEPHHFADSTSPKKASQNDRINLHPSPAASSHRASSGRRQACFREHHALS
jgi:hypothetical protein